MGENDNGVGPLTDELADQNLEIPNVEIADGAETVQVPVATIKQLSQTAKTALAQKKHWRDIAIDPASKKKYRDLVTAAPVNNAPSNTAEQDSLKTDVAALKSAEDKRQFGHANKLSPEETDHAFALAAGMGKKPSEVLDLPFFKSGLESMRRTARVGSATPGSSNRAPVVEGKNWKDMDGKDREKHFGAVVSSLQNRS